MIVEENFYFPKKKDLLKSFKKKEINVRTNHYEFEFDKNQSFSEWSVKFVEHDNLQSFLEDPKKFQEAIPSDSRNLILEVKKVNGKALYEKLGSNFISGLTLYSIIWKKVKEDQLVFVEHPQYAMVCQKVHDNISFKHLNKNAPFELKTQLIRFMNGNIKKILRRLNFVEWGRNRQYYNINEKINIKQHNLVLFNGYKTSVNLYEGGVKLLLDVSSRIIRTTNMWEEFLQKQIKSNNHSLILDFFKDKSCMANYGNNRVYRIDDIDFNTNPRTVFPDKQFKSYEDYFVTKYKVSKLKYPNQFMLVHNHKILEFVPGGEKKVKYEKILLIPELMLPTGLTDAMKSNFKVMKDIGQHTIKYPEERFKDIEMLMNSINNHKDEEKSFQFRINKKTNAVTGYNLDFPQIRTGKNLFKPKHNGFNLPGLNKKKDVNNWVLFYDYMTEGDVDTVVDNMYEASKRYKLTLDYPNYEFSVPNNCTAEKLHQMIKKKKKAGSPDLIFFFVSRKTAKFLYRHAKAYFNSKGIATQFFVSFNYKKDRNNLSKYSNILLQMVCKLGGSLWEIESDVKDAMVCGTDVYHCNREESMVSLVSQMGDNFNKFYSLACRQKRGAQIMAGVYKMVLETVKFHGEQYGRLPEKFLFFRCGVGESQIDELIEFEIRRIVESLKTTYKEKAPKLTFILVNKLVNDKFAISGKHGLKNPEGGLAIVDHVVQHDVANFYLIAQKVNQGTARPTHYKVIYSEGGFDMEKIIEMAYKFTFNYTNWQGPVKVPAPCQYAHKLSNLAGIARSPLSAENLKEVLYFL